MFFFFFSHVGLTYMPGSFLWFKRTLQGDLFFPC